MSFVDMLDGAINERRRMLAKIKNQAERIRKLESAVKLALDLSENGLIDYQEYGLTCYDDIEQKYRNALGSPR